MTAMERSASHSRSTSRAQGGIDHQDDPDRQGASAQPADGPAIPPVVLVADTSAAPAARELRQALDRLIANGSIEEPWARRRAQCAQGISDRSLEELVAIADGRAVPSSPDHPGGPDGSQDPGSPASAGPHELLAAFGPRWVAINAPSLTLVHLARLVSTSPPRDLEDVITLRAGWGVDPRTVEEALTRAGIARETIDEIVVPWAWTTADPEVAWPWMLEHAEELTARLATSYGATPVLRALRHAPGVPPVVLPALADIAVGRSERNRLLAQELLAGRPEALELATATLEAERPAVRRAGALWLVDMAEPRAVAALRRAYAQEEDWQARAGILRALRASGEEVTDLLSPQVLTDQAAVAPRRTPVALSWLGFELLPRVRWADGEPVEDSVVRWWVLLAHKLKTPDGRGLIDLYLSQLMAQDAARLGLAVVEAWAAWSRDASKGQSLPTKGLLAFAVAAQGPGLARVARSCLRTTATWRAESEAVLMSLRANGSAEAMEVIIAASQRHRLPRVRATATEMIQQVAQERCWSPEELGDRCIPTAGFSADGMLHVDYGDREFLGRLAPDLSIVLTGPDGRVRAGLPPARKGEDPEVVARAKSALSAARKEARAVLAAQADRLYEAMCTQRHWALADWQALLAGHPLASQLITRLVWALDEPSQRRTVRPSEDGALLGLNDAVVTPSPRARMSLVHGSLMDAQEAQAWREHLADYEVSPLFDQFSATAPQAAPGQISFEERRGRRVSVRELHRELRARGYLKSSHHLAWGEEYQKEFPIADLRVVIRIDGGGGPDQTAVMDDMTIVRGRHDRPVPFGDIPPVLLAEAHADYLACADPASA